MKRLMSSSLITFLQNNRTCLKADLFAITLPTGAVLYATEGQFDISLLVGGLLNGGFLGSEGIPDSWTANGDQTLSYVTSPAPLYGQSLMVTTATGNFGGVNQVLPFQAGDTFFAQVYTQTVGSATADIGVHFLDSSGGIISQAWGQVTGAADWTPLGVTAIAPAGTVNVRVMVVTSNAGDTAYFYGCTVGTPGWSGAQVTFRSNQYGVWSRGTITSEAGYKCASNTMSLSCIVQQETLYPGLPIGLLSAALNHLFDGATVRVYTAYMPIGGYGDVSAGIETKWQGTITRPTDYTRNKVEFECADPLYLLNMKVPTRLMQSNCPFGFADSNCGLAPGNFTVNFTANSGSGQTVLVPQAAFSQADGYFTQGVVTCLTGANAGLSQTVRTHANGSLVTMVPWILPVSVGDAFSVIKGCAKTTAACAGTKRADGSNEVQDYRLRFGGTPFTPTPSTSI